MESDAAYLSQYEKTSRFLADAVNGDLQSIPAHYASYLDHTFSNGDISLLPLIRSFSNFEDLEPWQFDEALEILHRVDPKVIPPLEGIAKIDVSALLSESSVETLDFVEDNLGTAEKVEKVLKTVIESVFNDKINSIRDRKGKYPSANNNFLLEEDGTFAGTFMHEHHKFHFEIAPREVGWICTYRLSEESLDKIPKRVTDMERDKKKKEQYRPVRSQGWS